jgi:hypothetical protein
MRRISNPNLKLLDDKKNGILMWQLLEDVKFGLESDTGPSWIIVPKDFTTDLYSIPTIARILLQTSEENPIAAIIHDYLYANKGNITIEVNNQLVPYTYSRKNCDKLFKVIMTLTGVPRWKIFCMYTAVKFGGKIGWGK